MLLFDLGNTSLKCALWKDGSAEAEISFSTADDFKEKLSSWLKVFAGSDIYISSVVPEKLSELKAVLDRENFNEKSVINITDFKVIETNVEKVEKVGIDRLLASRAAFEQSAGAVITVDLGSAITVDYVDSKGVFQGGAILPGALLWYKALRQNTSQLPLVSFDEKPQSAVGKNTYSAIQAGTYFGIAGAVNALVEKCVAESGSDPEIFVTGGGYASVKDSLSFNHIYDRNLVFKGIAAAAGEQDVSNEELVVLRACRLGPGGIVQLWCRGDNFRKALEPFLRSKSGKSLSAGKVSEVQYCFLNDGKDDIDEVLIGWYENYAEVNCHGGTLSALAVIKMLEGSGFREIKSEEWWQGEVDSGRIDIFSAQSYLAMENTETLLQTAVLSKGFYINEKINELKERGENVQGFLQKLAKTYNCGNFILKKHIVALVGAPNTGKSTCFNAMLVKDRAMVSEVAGTTRDCVRHGAELGGLAVELVDTAGLLGEAEGVDKIAVERAHEVIAEADLRIMLFDSGRDLNAEDIKCINSCKGLNTIYAGNKNDLAINLKESSLRENGIAELDISFSSLESGVAGLVELAGEFLWQGAGVEKSFINENEYMIATDKQLDYVKELIDD